MTEPIPNCLMRKYAFLWNRFKEKEFDPREACEALKDGEATVSLALSDMKKARWLEVRINPQDSRKRAYRLLSPQEGVSYVTGVKATLYKVQQLQEENGSCE